ncbi:MULTISPECIES: hypothetical protein [unclassified Microbacterium]|uniref:hypothetical protein n=1 Tax=unclassified Microbacterium TaxID=2609290 RepID=UPI0038672B87
MTDTTPTQHDADDAHADDDAPTPVVSDEVSEDAARAGSEATTDRGDDNESFPQGPAITHP